MSNIEPTDVDDQTIDQLRARADLATRLERDNKLKDAELAIVRAGIPTGTKVGQAFLGELAGREDVDLARPEEIQKAAIEWGLFTAEGSEAKDPPADQAALAAARAGLHGATAPDAAAPPPADIVQEGWAKFNERITKQGARREDAAAEVIDRLVTGAVRGDERAVVAQGSSMGAPIQRRYEDRDIPFVSGRA